MNDEGLEAPQAVKNATSQYCEDSDTIGSFINECLIEQKYVKVKIKFVYEEYGYWCAEYGYKPLNNRNFIAELRRKGLEIKASTGNMAYLFDYKTIETIGEVYLFDENNKEEFDMSIFDMSLFD